MVFGQTTLMRMHKQMEFLIGMSNYLSAKVWLLLTWLQSSWKLFEVYIWDGSGQEIWF